MPRISEEESNARRTEIIDACEKLYQSESYHAITMTQIAGNVSFGRANIYNYFQSKDEVLLALLQREHQLWTKDLRTLRTLIKEKGLSLDEVARRLAKNLEARTQMLKLMAMNLYDMEQNSRIEKLIEFKRSYGESVDAPSDLIKTVKGEWSKQQIHDFLFAFMPFMNGIYPYVYHSEKQLEAMRAAGVAHEEFSIYSITYPLVKRLLEDKE